MKHLISSLSLLLTTHLCLPQTNALDSPAPPELTLRQAIESSLYENLGLRIQYMDLGIAEEGLTAQKAVFDPTIYSRANISQSDQEWTDLEGENRQTISESRSYSLGMTKRVKTGGQVTASTALSRSDGSSFNPELNQLVGGGLSERASLNLEFTQPLLRDFGTDVNLANVRRAESEIRVADLQTRSAIYDLLQNTELAYWRVSDAYERLALNESNIDLAERQLEESQERERLGLATKLETLQAEANLAQRKEQVIRAQQRIRETIDTLFLSIGALQEDLAIELQVSVQDLPESTFQLQNFNNYLLSALEQNFDTTIQEELLVQLEQQRILANNEKRPQVDLSLSGSYIGLSPLSGKDAYSEAFDRRGDDWGIGFAFSLPWGSRSAKSSLNRTLLQIDQAELRLVEIKQDLIRSARSAWRELEASRQQYEAAALVVQLQEATYEQEQGKYDEGLSTFRQLLELQRDLDQAKLSLLDARLAAIEAEINLARIQGTILQRHNLDWNSPPFEEKE